MGEAVRGQPIRVEIVKGLMDLFARTLDYQGTCLENLGLTTGGKVTGGNPSPSSPLALTGTVEVFFGDPTWSQAGIIVDWSGLAPGFVGLYQLNLRVPGTHIKGDALSGNRPEMYLARVAIGK